MTANKKKSINKIVPAIEKPSGVDFKNLKQGECFLYKNSIWMKETPSDQIAINLANGTIDEDLCGSMVTPVEIEIRWKEKK